MTRSMDTSLFKGQPAVLGGRQPGDAISRGVALILHQFYFLAQCIDKSRTDGHRLGCRGVTGRLLGIDFPKLAFSEHLVRYGLCIQTI